MDIYRILKYLCKGISFETMSRQRFEDIVKGKTLPSYRELVELSYITNINMDFIIGTGDTDLVTSGTFKLLKDSKILYLSMDEDYYEMSISEVNKEFNVNIDSLKDINLEEVKYDNSKNLKYALFMSIKDMLCDKERGLSDCGVLTNIAMKLDEDLSRRFISYVKKAMSSSSYIGSLELSQIQ